MEYVKKYPLTLAAESITYFEKAFEVKKLVWNNLVAAYDSDTQLLCNMQNSLAICDELYRTNDKLSEVASSVTYSAMYEYVDLMELYAVNGTGRPKRREDVLTFSLTSDYEIVDNNLYIDRLDDFIALNTLLRGDEGSVKHISITKHTGDWELIMIFRKDLSRVRLEDTLKEVNSDITDTENAIWLRSKDVLAYGKLIDDGEAGDRVDYVRRKLDYHNDLLGKQRIKLTKLNTTKVEIIDALQAAYANDTLVNIREVASKESLDMDDVDRLKYLVSQYETILNK